MKACIITFALCFFSVVTFAVDTTMVKLMKSVVAIDIGRHYTEYYVFRKASEPQFNWFRNDEVQKIIPGMRIEDFNRPDTAGLYWTDYHLPGAIYIDKKHIASSRDFKKLLKSLPKVDSITGEIKGVYKLKRTKQLAGDFLFSKPAFTADKKYALITIAMDDAGYSYILKNVNGNWKAVYISHWIT
jgi:hypothetical protein